MINPEKYSVNNITGSINILECRGESEGSLPCSPVPPQFGAPHYSPVDEKNIRRIRRTITVIRNSPSKDSFIGATNSAVSSSPHSVISMPPVMMSRAVSAV